MNNNSILMAMAALLAAKDQIANTPVVPLGFAAEVDIGNDVLIGCVSGIASTADFKTAVRTARQQGVTGLSLPVDLSVKGESPNKTFLSLTLDFAENPTTHLWECDSEAAHIGVAGMSLPATDVIALYSTHYEDATSFGEDVTIFALKLTNTRLHGDTGPFTFTGPELGTPSYT